MGLYTYRAGELLLDIEARIGEIADKEERVNSYDLVSILSAVLTDKIGSLRPALTSRDLVDHAGTKIAGQQPSGKGAQHHRKGTYGAHCGDYPVWQTAQA